MNPPLRQIQIWPVKGILMYDVMKVFPQKFKNDTELKNQQVESF